MDEDKCNLCALKVIFDQDAIRCGARKVENFFDVLHKLQKEGIIEPGHSRRSFASNDGSGDKSEMCAVNSKFFLPDNKDNKCPEFILNMNLSVPDGLSLNLSKKNIILATTIKFLTWGLVVLTIALLVLGILPLIQNTPTPTQHPVKIEQNINLNTERNQQHGKINNITNLQNERHK